MHLRAYATSICKRIHASERLWYMKGTANRQVPFHTSRISAMWGDVMRQAVCTLPTCRDDCVAKCCWILVERKMAEGWRRHSHLTFLYTIHRKLHGNKVCTHTCRLLTSDFFRHDANIGANEPRNCVQCSTSLLLFVTTLTSLVYPSQVYYDTII